MKLVRVAYVFLFASVLAVFAMPVGVAAAAEGGVETYQ